MLPFDTKKHQIEFDAEATHDFYFNDDNFINIPSLMTADIPLISGVMYNHHIVLLNLCRHYYDQQNWKMALQALDRIEQILPHGILPVPDDLKDFISELRNEIQDNL
jgi:hypothetical protein